MSGGTASAIMQAPAVGVANEGSAQAEPGRALDIASLTSRVARGDDSAFALFYDSFTPRVFGFLMVLTGADESLARELLQVVMIRVARKFRRFESEEKLCAWLWTIARNALIDHRRAEARRRKREDQVEEAAAPSESWWEAELENALRALEPAEQEIIRRFYFEEESQNTLASRLGVSVRAIEGRLARAREKLRQTILQRRRNETG